MGNKKVLTPKDFEQMFGASLSPFVAEKIQAFDFTYQELTEAERDAWLLKIVGTLLDPGLPFSGEHRHQQWEKGWGENLEEYSKSGDVELISPRYFGKYPVVRIMRRFVKPVSENFERNSLSAIEYWLFDKYLRDVKHVYEFGCGTGHNLLRARQVNPEAELWGLDWAESSQKLIEKMRTNGVDKKLFSQRFDFFRPDESFSFRPKAAVYTVAALEQVGERYGEFVEFLLKNRPQICFHIEPIGELLDQSKLLDYLSVKYFEKRKYLSGFLTHLRDLEKQGRVEIINAQRSNIGSLYIDGYSVIVWKPK